MLPPGLTTFESQIHDTAEGIAGMVVRALDAPDAPPETRLVRPRLVLRGSHGPAPAQQARTMKPGRET
jgi:LacI family transcriptional regulator